uniref:Uncharacterized protein n=1 Tax=Chlamydomonas leiostraca TaxID=1034604 RepID=A0A7S0RG02_9CHLO|mmetsp:Transcript_21566/g.54887  ORF Transcript_21566/g.54887 Transcript_21566/m.54887 type:complete len:643 (+) Transcript_21566:98-2026(+)
MLSLKHFYRAPDKVRQVEFHPVLPWVVSATKSDYITVWDYEKQQLILELQLGVVGEEELSGDAELARVHAKDSAVTVNSSLPPHTTSRTPTGKVRDVRFLDADVAAAQLTANHLMASGTGAPQPTSAPLTGLRGQRLLLVVGEVRVLLVDLVSRAVRELPRALLEGRAPTCVAFLLMGGQSGGDRDTHVLSSPVLALGCNDGVVRLVALSTLRPVGRCVSAHKSSVVALAVTGVRGMPHESLVAGYAGGSVSAWEPLSKALPVGGAPSGMGVADISPKADADKVHDKEVVGVVAAAVAEDPESAPSRLIMTCGVDSRLYGLDPLTLKEGVKVKLDPKAAPTCCAYAPRGFMASGAHCVLVGTQAGIIMAVHPPSGSVKLAAHLASLVPAGAKKAPKIYGLAVHPGQPQLVAAACNTGTALLRLDALPPLPVAPLPLRSPAQALPIGAGGGGSGVTFLLALGQSVQCVSAAVVDTAQLEAAAAAPPPSPPKPRDNTHDLLDLLDDALPPTRTPPPAPSASALARKRPTIVQVLGCMKVAQGKPTVRSVLAASADGSYASAVWPAARSYAIFRQGAASWEEIASGSGVSVAWHASAPMFAVVVDGGVPAPLPAAPLDKKDKKEKKDKKDKKKKKKEKKADSDDE